MSRSFWGRTAGPAVVAIVLTGCPQSDPPAPPPANAAPAPEAEAPAPTPEANILARGKVLETMDGGSYTYVKLEAGGAVIWAAGPQTTINVGDVLELPAGMPMKDFHSGSLGRTFEMIYFVESFKLRQANGRLLRVRDVLQRREELAGVIVAVRGKVTQVTTQVMGKTWLHIVDEGGHELVVSGRGNATQGETVICEGVVALDRDLGGGYRFKTLLEDAEIGHVPATHPVGPAARDSAGPLAPASRPTEDAAEPTGEATAQSADPEPSDPADAQDTDPEPSPADAPTDVDPD